MAWTIEKTVDETFEALELQTLKDHLRMNTDDEDTLLGYYLTTAREMFQHKTGMQVCHAHFKMYLDQWSSIIYLPLYPVMTIVSVLYGSTAFTDYISNLKRTPARITPNSFPQLDQTISPKITIHFHAGYSNASDIPQSVKTAIMLLAGHYYNQREAYGEVDLKEVPLGFARICDKYRMGMLNTMGND